MVEELRRLSRQLGSYCYRVSHLNFTVQNLVDIEESVVMSKDCINGPIDIHWTTQSALICNLHFSYECMKPDILSIKM